MDVEDRMKAGSVLRWIAARVTNLSKQIKPTKVVRESATLLSSNSLSDNRKFSSNPSAGAGWKFDFQNISPFQIGRIFKKDRQKRVPFPIS